QELVDATFARVRDFFSLPVEEKMQIAMSKTPGFAGYSPMKEASSVAEGRRMQEGFNMNLDLPADDPLVVSGKTFYNPNSWPGGPAGYRDGMLAYFGGVRGLSRRLFDAFALSLDLPEDYFTPMIDKPITLMRVNHYAAQALAKDDDDIGGIA